MKDDETVCLDTTQMNNIIDAARADEANDKNRIKKTCPKALSFVRGFRPKKKNAEKEEEGIIEKHIKRRVAAKADGIMTKILDKVFGYES